MELELIDGNPVLSHVVRFKDRTTISETDAQAVRDGSVIVWLVRTVCEPPSYHPLKKDSDERYRFNIQDVKAAAVLHDELRDQALAYLDDPSQTQGRLVFDAPTYSAEDAPAELRDGLAFHETNTTWPADVSTPATPVPQPGNTLVDDYDLSTRVVGSVYGEGGSDTQRLLEEWSKDL